MKYEVPLETLLGKTIGRVKKTRKGLLIVLDTEKRFLLAFPMRKALIRGEEFIAGSPVASVEVGTRHSKDGICLIYKIITGLGEFSVRFPLETWKIEKKNGLFWLPKKNVCSCAGVVDVISAQEGAAPGEIVLRMEFPTKGWHTPITYTGSIDSLFVYLEKFGFAPTADDRIRLVREIQGRRIGTGRPEDVFKRAQSIELPLGELIDKRIVWIDRSRDGLFLYDAEDNLFFLRGNISCPDQFFFKDSPVFIFDREKTWRIGHMHFEFSGVESLHLVLMKPLVRAMEGKKPGACRVIYPGNMGEAFYSSHE